MHKKILFVIPGLKTGGTNSSLSALYSQIKDKYDITVLPLSNKRNANYSFDDVVLRASFISNALHINASDSKIYMKPIVYAIKSIRHLTIKITGKDLLDWYYQILSKHIERKRNYNYIIAFEEGNPTQFVSHFKNKNKIGWIHCNYDMYCPKGVNEEPIYSKYKYIICVSKYTSLLFSNRYPALKNKVRYIYNLIDVNSIIVKSQQIIDDDRFKIDSKHIIVSAGRIDPVKRFSMIPKVARTLLNMGLSFKWYILGPTVSLIEYKRLYENIAKYDVTENVICLGNKKNPFPYLVKSDIYVCTSESEACPMVFNEAMILKKPVVTTNFGSASEFIKNGVNGSICDCQELANSIFNLLSNEDKYIEYQNKLTDSTIFNKDIIASINSLFS